MASENPVLATTRGIFLFSTANNLRGEVIFVVRFKFALVVGTMFVLLFSSAAMATADRDAADGEQTTENIDNPCCVNHP